MKFKKKSQVTEEIPTASMPDIIFMLLIFFMVTTVLKRFTGLPVTLPEAEKIEKIESRRHTSYIWMDGAQISCDDQILEVGQVSDVVYSKLIADPQLLICLKGDRQIEMEVLHKVHEELRAAGALRINYSTKLKAS
jgi:biopolymer transport protein ExbD